MKCRWTVGRRHNRLLPSRCSISHIHPATPCSISSSATPCRWSSCSTCRAYLHRDVFWGWDLASWAPSVRWSSTICTWWPLYSWHPPTRYLWTPREISQTSCGLSACVVQPPMGWVRHICWQLPFWWSHTSSWHPCPMGSVLRHCRHFSAPRTDNCSPWDWWGISTRACRNDWCRTVYSCRARESTCQLAWGMPTGCLPNIWCRV